MPETGDGTLIAQRYVRPSGSLEREREPVK